MRIILKVLTLSCALPLCFLPIISKAQKGKAAAGGGGSGAKTSTTAPAGGTSVSGFSYLLPRNYSMEYRTQDISKPVIEKMNTPVAPVTFFVNHSVLKYQARGWYLTFNAQKDTGLLRSTDFRDILATLTPPNGITYNQFSWGTFLRTKDSLTKITVAQAYPLNPPEKVTHVSTRIVQLDTIDRYYLPTHTWGYHLLHRHWGQVFDLNRGRISVTQADSGRLNIEIGGGDFPDAFHDKDIKFTTYLPTNEFSPAIPIITTDSAKNFFLKISPRGRVGNPQYFIKLRYSVIQYGTVTVPFKYRFSNGRKIGGFSDSTKKFAESTATAPSESTASINIVGYLGWKFGSTRFYYDQTQTHNTVACMVSVFAGPSLINLTANNVNYGEDLNRYASSQLAASTGFSFTGEWRTFNFGLFYGWDIPVEKSPWVYRYKPWIGIGIGFSLGMFTNGNIKSQGS